MLIKFYLRSAYSYQNDYSDEDIVSFLIIFFKHELFPVYKQFAALREQNGALRDPLTTFTHRVGYRLQNSNVPENK